MKIEVSAPSNIALIKYMGKIETALNRPTNSSLSYTLEALRTYIEIEPIAGDKDQWAPLEKTGLEKISLSDKGRDRYLAHFANLKKAWNIPGNYLIRSGNNFPSDCGLASSASSFAALTKAASRLRQDSGQEVLGPVELAEFSRLGSGSSCRSLMGPWVLWSPSGVRPLEFAMGPLLHSVIIVESAHKAVSSSEAHRRVVGSPLFVQRPERAEERLAGLVEALRMNDWQRAFELTWAEFWDMHALFETSKPAFGYFEPGTIEVLRELRKIWENGDGPLVTMDAGANIHLLFRNDQEDLQRQIEQQWQSRFRVFHSPKADLK